MYIILYHIISIWEDSECSTCSHCNPISAKMNSSCPDLGNVQNSPRHLQEHFIKLFFINHSSTEKSRNLSQKFYFYHKDLVFITKIKLLYSQLLSHVLHFPDISFSRGIFLIQTEIKPVFTVCPALAGRVFTSEPPEKNNQVTEKQIHAVSSSCIRS